MGHETPEHDNPDHAHAHPTWKQYRWVALILTVITALEVWAYYIPSLVASPFFVPLLLIMSAVKFIIVVMFYMHLKYDHRLFKALFTRSEERRVGRECRSGWWAGRLKEQQTGSD